MKILVCVKQVPNSEIIEFDEKTGMIKRDNNEVKINPVDLNAIETALTIKEKIGGTVECLTMGPPSAKEVILEAISLGVDNGKVLSDRRFASADVLATTNTLKEGIKVMDKYDLVILGRESSDGGTGCVTGELGERLGMPTIANVSKIIDITETEIEMLAISDELVKKIKAKLPVVINVMDTINDPRFPEYFHLLRSEKEEIKILSLDDLEDKNENNYGVSGSQSVIRRVFKKTKEVNMDFSNNENLKQKEMWTGSSQELAQKLENKLKEIKFL